MAAKICPQCGEEYEINQRFCSRDGATLASSPSESLDGQVIAGRYFVLRQLGQGAMGQVYLAEHVRMKRKVALKIMRPQLASEPDAITRFHREATNASRIDHPNVATVFDFGDTETGLLYLAMEFIDGQSLTSILEKAGRLDPERASNIIAQVAEALQAAHDQEILHRDLKPANIMLRKSRSGDVEVVKLVDFGISKIGTASQEVTVSGAIMGTPSYMSPEQLGNIPLDRRSDVFALGIVAFELLTGRLPFSSGTAFASMAARIQEHPLTLAEAAGDVPFGPGMEAVFSRVLANDRDMRYASAPEFARELAAAVRSVPRSGVSDDRSSVVALTPGAQRAVVVPGAEATQRQEARQSSAFRRATVAVVVALSCGALTMAVRHFVIGQPPAASAQASLPAARSAKTEVPRPTDSTPQATAAPTLAVADSGATSEVALRIGVGALSPRLRAGVASIAHRVGAVKLIDDPRTANIVVEADSNDVVTVIDARTNQRLARLDTAKMRSQLFPVMRRESAILQLRQFETPASRARLSLQFASERHSFADGDELQFRVRSARPGYLTLTDIGPDGVVTVLNPSALVDVGLLPQGRDVAIPGTSDGVLRAALPAGPGVVCAIVTSKPIAIKRTSDFVTSVEDQRLLEKIIAAIKSDRQAADGGGLVTCALSYVVHE